MDPIDLQAIGNMLRAGRRRRGLSQPAAAQQAEVSVRLWSEVERGERPNVSATTLGRMLAQVGMTLAARHMPEPAQPAGALERLASRAAEYADDLRRAAEFGIDLSLLQASLELTPLERIRANDEALAFFAAVRVTPGTGGGLRRGSA